ncbi:myelin-associated glycoprotein-like, partial [Clarias magur]
FLLLSRHTGRCRKDDWPRVCEWCPVMDRRQTVRQTDHRWTDRQTGCLCWSVRAGLVPTVPDHVLAMQGSCALIPCSFPSVNRSDVGVAVRLRYRFPSWRRHTAFSSDLADQLESKFRGRVTLRGALSTGDCSLIITDVSTSDPETYELELKERPGSWGGVKSIKVSVTGVPERPVLSVPPVVVLGQTVVLNCSVRISCPLKPPRLVWVWERGGEEGAGEDRRTKRVQTEGETSSLISSLSFTPSELLKPQIRCEAHYHGNRKSRSSSSNLNIHFPPMDVSIEVHTVQVREGGNVQLVCVCKADPPVIEYRWSYTHSSGMLPLPHHSHSVRLYNVTRHTRVQCAARNILGHTSSPLTRLNVQYAPVIMQNGSVCVWDGQVQECVCAVDSNPPPLITWSVNGSVPPLGFNTTSSHSRHTLQETLRGHTHTPLHTTCYAFNSLGNDTHTLRLRKEDNLVQDLISVGFGVLLLVLLSITVPLFVCLCRRRTERRRRGMGCAPALYPSAAGVYQERTPLYINCSEVTNIYTNGSYQLVYQNCTPCFIRTTQ